MRQYEHTPEELLGPGHLSAETIHGNARDMVCHVPECESYSCLHCTIEFKDMEIALQAGFTPCPLCKIILKRQSAVTADKALQ